MLSHKNQKETVNMIHKMQPREMGVAAVGISIVAATIGVFVGIPTASASNDQNKTALIHESKVDQQWAAVVSQFPESLPGGKKFPSNAPEFFTPQKSDPAEVHVFEQGLFESIAAAMWRCEWLDVAQRADAAGQASQLGIARAALARDTRLDFGASKAQGFEQYQSELRRMAGAQGVAVEKLEHAQNCGTGLRAEDDERAGR